MDNANTAYAEITIKGHSVIVDFDALPILLKYAWRISASGYAVTDMYVEKNGKTKRAQVVMHRLISAAKAYNKANKEINGEFAFQNEITKKR